MSIKQKVTYFLKYQINFSFVFVVFVLKEKKIVLYWKKQQQKPKINYDHILKYR